MGRDLDNCREAHLLLPPPFFPVQTCWGWGFLGNGRGSRISPVAASCPAGCIMESRYAILPRERIRLQQYHLSLRHDARSGVEAAQVERFSWVLELSLGITALPCSKKKKLFLKEPWELLTFYSSQPVQSLLCFLPTAPTLWSGGHCFSAFCSFLCFPLSKWWLEANSQEPLMCYERTLLSMGTFKDGNDSHPQKAQCSRLTSF